MNFFERIFKMATGTYQTPVSSNYLQSSYFGSNTSMTKDQLSAFDTQLAAMGLTKPAGIDNMVQDFDLADSDHNGKLTSAEVQAYLANKGFLTTTTSSIPTITPKNILLNVLSNLSKMQNNNNNSNYSGF